MLSRDAPPADQNEPPIMSSCSSPAMVDTNPRGVGSPASALPVSLLTAVKLDRSWPPAAVKAPPTYTAAPATFTLAAMPPGGICASHEVAMPLVASKAAVLVRTLGVVFELTVPSRPTA